MITFGDAIDVPGRTVPCPPYTSYWFETITEAPPSRLVATNSLTITKRTASNAGGTAVASATIDEDGVSTGLMVAVTFTSPWDVVLVDSFQDTLCSGTEAYGDATRVFFGRGDAGSIVRLNRGHTELDETIVAFLRPRPVAPGGIGATHLFRNIYVSVEGGGGGLLRITPVIDGLRLTDETIIFAVPSDGTRKVQRFEVPLSRTYTVSAAEVSRAGVIGTWFTVEVEAFEPFGCGDFEMAGFGCEYDLLETDVPGEVFTGESRTIPASTLTRRWYLAGPGSGVYKGAEGVDDAGAAIPVRIRTADAAPDGPGGEIVLTDIRLTVTRFNTEDWTVTVTPILDGVELEGTDVVLAGVVAPVTELLEIPAAQPYLVDEVEVSRYSPRGAFVSVMVTSEDSPDQLVIFEGCSIDFDRATESLVDVTNV